MTQSMNGRSAAGRAAAWFLQGAGRTLPMLLAFLAASCSGGKGKPPEEKVPVTVAVAQTKDVPIQIRGIGTVQPISSVAVRTQVGGQLTRVAFHEGDDVRRGQLLFVIDPRPYQAALTQARANLQRDLAQMRHAESQAARYAELVRKDFVTREEYEKYNAAAEAARATVAAERAAVETARLQLSYCEIRSPIDGRTGSLIVHAGNLVRPNDTSPLVVINQITPVYVQFSVPERDLEQLRARGLGAVPVSALPQGTAAEITDGRLSFVDNSVNTTTGTIALKATFPNRGRTLWPGQYVTVAVTLSERPHATVVPAQAVQTGQRGQYVYVVKGGDAVEMRPVAVFRTIGQETVVDSGVAPGETVVTDGQLRLTPQSKVLIKGER